MNTDQLLFVDDEPWRLELLNNMLLEGGIRIPVVFRKTGESVSDHDLQSRFVFLDHDLCLPGVLRACPHPTATGACSHQNGMHVVRRIIRMPVDPNQAFIVHSLNPTGGSRMFNALFLSGRRVVRFPVDHWRSLTALDFLKKTGLWRSR